MNKSQIRPDISRVSDATAIKNQVPKTNGSIRNHAVIPYYYLQRPIKIPSIWQMEAIEKAKEFHCVMYSSG